MQVQDEELLNEFRRSRICELCRGEIPGTPHEVKKKGRIVVVGGADPHHLMTGNYDIRMNLCSLHRLCHRLVESDVKAKERIWNAVCARERITKEQLQEIVWIIRRDQRCKIWNVQTMGPFEIPMEFGQARHAASR